MEPDEIIYVGSTVYYYDCDVCPGEWGERWNLTSMVYEEGSRLWNEHLQSHLDAAEHELWYSE